MTLKKNQIEDYEKKVIENDKDSIILEEIVNPLFVARMKRYGTIMIQIFNNFVEGGFTKEESMELTKIVLDYVLKSGSSDMPGNKSEPRGYA